MVLNITTEPQKYFLQLVELLKVFYPFNKLRKRQREVFAEILYHNHKIINQPSTKNLEDDSIRKMLLFDYDTKLEISKKLGISMANLYNIYKELRQFELLEKDDINPKFRYKYLQHRDILFKFIEKEDNK